MGPYAHRYEILLVSVYHLLVIYKIKLDKILCGSGLCPKGDKIFITNN